MTPPAAAVRAFYRVLEGGAPAEDDFLSDKAKRIPLRLPHTARRLRMWAGVSAYRSVEAAQRRARLLQPQRTQIARLVIPLIEPITMDQTGADPDHFTLTGEPSALLDCVAAPLIAVVPPEALQESR